MIGEGVYLAMAIIAVAVLATGISLIAEFISKVRNDDTEYVVSVTDDPEEQDTRLVAVWLMKYRCECGYIWYGRYTLKAPMCPVCRSLGRAALNGEWANEKLSFVPADAKKGD